MGQEWDRGTLGLRLPRSHSCYSWLLFVLQCLNRSPYMANLGWGCGLCYNFRFA
jgi:hypothetical protein